jgi:hypothetical protein
MINANDKIVEMLRKGHDADARAELVARLEQTCQESTDGQIGLAGFIDDLEATLAQAKEWNEIFFEAIG